MKRGAWGWTAALVITGGLWAVAGPVGASEALAQRKLCLGCHTVEKKVVGPAFHDIAARYAGDRAAPARLAQKIINGSAGAWGPVAMRANPQVSAEEARVLVQWILSK